jgi:hypothetical protein
MAVSARIVEVAGPIWIMAITVRITMIVMTTINSSTENPRARLPLRGVVIEVTSMFVTLAPQTLEHRPD